MHTVRVLQYTILVLKKGQPNMIFERGTLSPLKNSRQINTKHIWWPFVSVRFVQIITEKFIRKTFVNALLIDGKITGTTRDKLLIMNQRFLSLRRRIANTTTAEVNLFKKLSEEVSAELPPTENKPVSEQNNAR